LANTPSLGLFFVKEHVSAVVPKLVERKQELKRTDQKVKEILYDMDYSILSVKSLHGLESISKTSEMLQASIRMLEVMLKYLISWL
jgi:hypothetical protein